MTNLLDCTFLRPLNKRMTQTRDLRDKTHFIFSLFKLSLYDYRGLEVPNYLHNSTGCNVNGFIYLNKENPSTCHQVQSNRWSFLQDGTFCPTLLTVVPGRRFRTYVSRVWISPSLCYTESHGP